MSTIQAAPDNAIKPGDPVVTFITMNQMEPIRVLKSLGIMFCMFIGFYIMLNSPEYLYYSPPTWMKVLAYLWLYCVLLFYTIYQIVLVHPDFHSADVGQAVNAALWYGQENFSFLFAMIITLFVTPMAAMIIMIGILVIPTTIFIISATKLPERYGINFDNMVFATTGDANLKIVRKYILIVLAVLAGFVILTEFVKCIEDHFIGNIAFNLMKRLFQTSIYVTARLISVFLLVYAFYTYSVKVDQIKVHTDLNTDISDTPFKDKWEQVMGLIGGIVSAPVSAAVEVATGKVTTALGEVLPTISDAAIQYESQKQALTSAGTNVTNNLSQAVTEATPAPAAATPAPAPPAPAPPAPAPPAPKK